MIENTEMGILSIPTGLVLMTMAIKAAGGMGRKEAIKFVGNCVLAVAAVPAVGYGLKLVQGN